MMFRLMVLLMRNTVQIDLKGEMRLRKECEPILQSFQTTEKFSKDKNFMYRRSKKNIPHKITNLQEIGCVNPNFESKTQ